MFPNAQILQTVDTLKAPDAPILETVDISRVRDAPIIETVDESKAPHAQILNTFLILGGGQKGGQRGRLNAGRTGKRFAESAILLRLVLLLPLRFFAIIIVASASASTPEAIRSEMMSLRLTTGQLQEE